MWYPDGAGRGSTGAFMQRFAAGSSELAAWAAADAAPSPAAPAEPAMLSCNMAIVAGPAAAPAGRNGRHRRRRGRSPTELTGRRSGSGSPEPQRFPRPAPAAPRRRNGRPIVTLTYPNGIFDVHLRGYTLTVGHQVNTAEINGGGLAGAIAAFAPNGDVFRGRQSGRDGLVPPADRATPGSLRVDRPPGNGLTSGQLTFVAMYGQIYGGGPGRGTDDAPSRALLCALPRRDRSGVATSGIYSVLKKHWLRNCGW